MKITIKTDNAAFEDKGAECARILRELADKLADFGMPGRGEPIWLFDHNGNKVGECKGQ